MGNELERTSIAILLRPIPFVLSRANKILHVACHVFHKELKSYFISDLSNSSPLSTSSPHLSPSEERCYKISSGCLS